MPKSVTNQSSKSIACVSENNSPVFLPKTDLIQLMNDIKNTGSTSDCSQSLHEQKDLLVSHMGAAGTKRFLENLGDIQYLQVRNEDESKTLTLTGQTATEATQLVIHRDALNELSQLQQKSAIQAWGVFAKKLLDEGGWSKSITSVQGTSELLELRWSQSKGGGRAYLGRWISSGMRKVHLVMVSNKQDQKNDVKQAGKRMAAVIAAASLSNETDTPATPALERKDADEITLDALFKLPEERFFLPQFLSRFI